jgi:hypothetical protein
MRMAMDDFFVQDERAEYRWTLTETKTGPGGTSLRVHISGFEISQIGADGLITSSQGHFDGAEYQRQLQFGELPLFGDAGSYFCSAGFTYPCWRTFFKSGRMLRYVT